MANGAFAGCMDRLLGGSGSVFKGPYVSLGLPFKSGSSSSVFSSVSLGYTPYLHQEQAFLRLQSSVGASTIIATGTGSGKTESFLLPILDYCNSCSSSGVKAIILYPMNALATDQAARIAALINSHSLSVTAGLYVGQKGDKPTTAMGAASVITSRAAMRASPPDVLLTNYKMLDYMLIRPSDYGIWNGVSLRYLVVDELHTFDGAQGTDLACLIRRLRSRVGASSSLCCVGTSATLGADSLVSLCTYAAKVFAADFPTSSVITESRESAFEFLSSFPVSFFDVPYTGLLPVSGEDSFVYISRQTALWFGSSSVDLGYVCVRHNLFRKLFEVIGNDVVNVDDVLSEMRRVDQGVSGAMLLSMLALLSAARVGVMPLVHVRMQMWLRELQRMVASVDSSPVLRFAADLSAAALVNHLPVIHCRECGATGWGAVLRRGEVALRPDLNDFYRAFFSFDKNTAFFFPEKKAAWDARLHGMPGISMVVCTACLKKYENTDIDSCSCGCSSFVFVFFPDNSGTHSGKAIVTHNCPYCDSHNSLTILGSRAASLTSVMISQLMSSPFNSDKKLLTFSDSVQDAAHRAGFYQARTWRFNLRTAMQKFVGASGAGLSLDQFTAEFLAYWKFLFTPEEFVSTFIAPNMMWFSEYEAMVNGSGVVAPSLIRSVCSRLDWEICSEYGFSSRIGRTLDRSGASLVYVDVASALPSMLETLQNSLGSLRSLTLASLSYFVHGLLLHMKYRGAIAHSMLDSYVHGDGTEYLLSQHHIAWMPSFGPNTRAPVFPVNVTRGSRFERLVSGSRPTWYQVWINKCLPFGAGHDSEVVLASVFASLAGCGVLREYSTKYGKAWGILPSSLVVTDSVDVFTCSSCGNKVSVAASSSLSWAEAPCLRGHCSGTYSINSFSSLSSLSSTSSSSPDYYKSFYSGGSVNRLFAAEHTGLLDRVSREKLESQFKASVRKPWYPNLLSSTPTLEMGIDIGDLSSLILCSVPPTQANYLQRTGRAGRRDGNALTLTVAAGRPHDLYFYAEPLSMMQGDVTTPDVFLEAGAVLARQLVAFCFDRWVEDGGDDVPAKLAQVFSALDKVDKRRFPWNLLGYVESFADALLRKFCAMFKDSISGDVYDQLRVVTHGDEATSGSLSWRVLTGLRETRDSRDGFRKTVRSLNLRIKKKKAEVARSSSYDNELFDLENEKRAFQKLASELDAKNTFNFFTDEGILPNYAFPEAGVQLKSVIYRRNRKTGGSDTWSFDYERAGSTAISELVPGSHFYAGGRRVQIDQIDLKLSEIEDWRFCDQCSHSERYSSENIQTECPHCGSTMWPDEGQRRPMARLRQVFATTSDRDSRIADDSEERKPVFYNRQMLVDFKGSDVESAWKISGEDLPFGFEYLKKVTFREINFGEQGVYGEKVSIAGVEIPRNGFRICKSCGKVQFSPDKPVHSLTCTARRKDDDSSFITTLYLYREFASEAVRFLLPVSAMSAKGVLESFVATLQLGLRLKYGGSVAHIRATTADEPVENSVMRKKYLVLFDTVPGGTGYLKNLIKEPEVLMEVLALALAKLKACDCCKDPEKDGCYKCLYAYRDSRNMDVISRDTAIDFVGKLLARKDDLVETESLRTIGINRWLESELEELFIEKLAAQYSGEKKFVLKNQVVNGKQGYYLKAGDTGWNIEPQVNIDCAVPSRADFVIYPASVGSGIKPIVIFTDGYSFHADRVGKDLLQRTAIIQTGRYNVWSLTWADVAGTKEDWFRNDLKWKSENAVSLMNGIRDKVNLSSVHRHQDDSSFQWLVAYLTNPLQDLWSRYAWTCSFVHFDGSVSTDRTKQFHWNDDLKKAAGEASRLVLADSVSSSQYGFVEGNCWKLFTRQNNADVSRMDVASMHALLYLDDRIRDDDFEYDWNSFLRLLNLYQFLPGCVSVAASSSDFPQDIKALLAASIDHGEVFSGISPDWEEVFDLVDPSLSALLARLRDSGAATPEIGVDIASDTGRVVAQAEIIWKDSAQVILLDREMKNSTVLENMGFAVHSISEVTERPMGIISIICGG